MEILVVLYRIRFHGQQFWAFGLGGGTTRGIWEAGQHEEFGRRAGGIWEASKRASGEQQYSGHKQEGGGFPKHWDAEVGRSVVL